jgi:hypothetical protein
MLSIYSELAQTGTTDLKGGSLPFGETYSAKVEEFKVIAVE